MHTIVVENPKTGEISHDEYVYINELIKQYPDFSIVNLLFIIGGIRAPIFYEINTIVLNINRSIRLGELDLDSAERVELELIKKTFDTFAHMQDINYTVDLNSFFNKENSFGKILYLLGHNIDRIVHKFIHDVNRLPINYSHNIEFRRSLSIEILNNMRRATLRTLNPIGGIDDLTLEDKEILTATDKHSKFSKLRIYNKLHRALSNAEKEKEAIKKSEEAAESEETLENVSEDQSMTKKRKLQFALG